MYTQSINSIDTSQLPEITELKKGNPLFDQILQSISEYHQSIARGASIPMLRMFRYRTIKQESLFLLSARLNLPHATIATLNQLQNPDLPAGKDLLIPSIPGIFINLKPTGSLEKMIHDRLTPEIATGMTFGISRGTDIKMFTYLHGKDFTPAERKIFLGRMFRSPLESSRISSTFGNRRNPFSGAVVLHAGIDLVAPIGSAVLAVADGKVLETGYDTVYGNYIFIDHQNGYKSFYAHLQSISIQKTTLVTSGSIIGKLGNSGQSTGAHLHLELHQNGQAKDPILLIKFD